MHLKRLVFVFLLAYLGATTGSTCYAQQVGINAPTPHPQAMLEVAATDRGIRIPRLSQAAIDAIDPAPAGLLVYNTDVGCFAIRNDDAWLSLCHYQAADCSVKPTAVASGPASVVGNTTLALTADPEAEATYHWTGPNGFERFVQNPSRENMGATDAGNYILRTYRFGCFSEPDTVNVTVTLPVLRSCAELLAFDPTLPDGEYEIDPDGAGPLAPFDCYCDMTTDGGGWTLVLNYLHQGGTNPALNVRTTNLPLLGSDVLGTDEAATAFWGHAAPALLNEIPKTEVRFWGQTGAHARVIHFRTNHANTLAYFNTGTGSMDGIQLNFTALAGHTANLPGAAANWFISQGDVAMTEFPFWLSGNYHWGIRGLGDRWEVDDYPDNDSQNTHHQIWVR